MEIITEEIQTKQINIDMIKEKLTELIGTPREEGNYPKSCKINLSLDLTDPHYIEAVLMSGENGEFFRVEYFRKVPDDTVKATYTGDVFMKTADKDIDTMLQAIAAQMDAEREEFYDRCYKAYQLDWMISHGCSIDDFYDAIKASVVDQVAEGYDIDSSDRAENAMQCAIEEFHDAGFGSGSLWACEDEFLDNEYMDMAYMKSLFENMFNTEMMKKLYLRYTQDREFSTFENIPEMSVETTAGILNTYKSCDPGQPGVVVMLKPEGYDCEIDCSYVSVYENPEYRTKDNEGDKDVVIMSYGDATTEDYTTKEIIRRGDIEEGLN